MWSCAEGNEFVVDNNSKCLAESSGKKRGCVSLVAKCAKSKPTKGMNARAAEIHGLALRAMLLRMQLEGGKCRRAVVCHEDFCRGMDGKGRQNKKKLKT